MDTLADIIKQLEMLAKDLEMDNTSASTIRARHLRVLAAKLFAIADNPCDCGMY